MTTFDVQGDYTEERASRTTSSPALCTKVREPSSTVRLFRRHTTNLLKADDGAVLPGPRTSPRLIDHTSEHS